MRTPLRAFFPVLLWSFSCLVTPVAEGARGARNSAAKTALLEDDDLLEPAPEAASNPPQEGNPSSPEGGGNAVKTAAELVAATNFHHVTLSLQAALNTAAKPASPDTEQSLLAARVTAATLSGNWSGLRELLGSIGDKAAAGSLYTGLLGKLADACEYPASQNVGVEAQYDQRPERVDAQRKHLLMPKDVLGILEAAPIPFNATHLKALKTLVSGAGPAMIEPLVRALSTGLPGIGGKEDPEARTLAARLLLNPRTLAEAGSFLPLQASPSDASITTGQLVALVQYYSLKSVSDRKEEPILQAALACTALVERTDSKDSVGLYRLCNSLLRLLTQLQEDSAADFFRTKIAPRKEILEGVLNTLSSTAARDLNSTNEKVRRARLILLHRVMLGLREGSDALPASARALALHWLDEAETAIRFTPDFKEPAEAREAIGRIFGFQTAEPKFLSFSREEVAQLAPADGFLARMPAEVAQRIRFAKLRLKLTDPEGDLTLSELKEYIQMYGREGGTALAEQYLKGWSQQRASPEEDPELDRLRNMGLFVPGAPKGLPQTRALQERALREFKRLLDTLREVVGAPLAADQMAAAFIRIHSKTEVFDLKHIEAVFGPAEEIDYETLSSLLNTMRDRLSGDWNNLAAQQQAGTNRTEAEVRAEVARGYSVAAELIQRNRARLNAGWRASLQEAVLLFDAAEFHFKHQGALVDYVGERAAALAALQKAAELYTGEVPALRPSEWSLDPFLAWTSAMLGSTDPKRLAWKENRVAPEFAKVHSLLHGLPEPARSHHLREFGALVQKVTPSVPAQMRYKFVDALVQVVGPEVREMRPSLELLKHFGSLTEEARLHARFDGPTTVTHGVPFGVVLALEHTEKLHREAGGFSKYLQNPGALSQNNPFVFFGLRNAKQMNYRDEFQKNIHKALQDAFEVVSITFHDPSVQPVPLSDPGWQATPLAYLVLRTKDISVDRLPPIQIDLEFAEGRSQVVLPVVSQVEPMRTTNEDTTPRPLENLEVLMTLDERDWIRGKLTVDINAKGRGIIPDLKTLFLSPELEGFTLGIQEQQNSVTQFVSDKTGTRALSERNWQLSFQRKTDFHGDALFRFPAMHEGFAAKIEFKHFVDADLYDIPAGKARSGIVVGRGRDTALRLGLFGVLVALAVFALWRWRGVFFPVERAQAEDLPAVLTPLSVIAHLRGRIESSPDRAAREVLRREITELERRCFSAQPSPPSEAELVACMARARASGLS